MRLARPTLVAVLVGSSLVVGAASAATSKSNAGTTVCNLVTDPSGDANSWFFTNPGLPVPNDDYLDILSGDLASDAKNVTAVIRMKAVGADSMSPTGASVYFNFSVGNTPFYIAALLDSSGVATYEYGDFSGPSIQNRNTLGTATGHIDVARKEIHITAPAKGFRVPIRPGTKLSGLDILAQHFIGTRANPAYGWGPTPTADEATSAKVYKVGTPSCVTVGK